MNFIKTQKLLSQQVGQKSILLDEVLELMRTYLTELRYHTGTSVDKCHIGNISQVIASLAAVCNDILYVYRAKEQEIQDSESRYTQVLVKAQNSCADYHSRIAQLDEQIRQSEGRLAELEKLQQEAANREASLVKLQQESADLQAQIDKLSPEDSDTEAGKLKALLDSQKAALARAVEEYQCMQQEHTQTETKLEKENARLAQLRIEVSTAMTKLKETGQIIKDQEDVKRGLSDETIRLEHEIWLLKEKNDDAYHAQFDMFDRIAEGQARLEKQQAENDMLHKQALLKEVELQELQLKYDQNHDLFNQLTQQYNDLEAKQVELYAQIAARQQEIQAITQDGGTVLDQIKELADRKNQLDLDYQQACLLREHHQQETDDTNKQLDQLKQVNDALIQALKVKNAELADLTATHQQKTDQLAELTTSIEKLEGKLQNLQSEISRHRTEVAAAKETLKADQEEFDHLLEQHVSLTVDVEAQKTYNQVFISDHLEPVKAQMAELVVQCRKAQEQKEELKNTIKLLTDKFSELSKMNSHQLAAVKSWQLQLDNAQAEYEKNQQAVAILTADFNLKSSESKALLEREKELRELLDEKNVARITAELESCNKRLAEDLLRAQQTETLLTVKRKEVDDLQKRLSTLLAELEGHHAQEEQLKKRYNSARRELDQITGPENCRRSEQLRNQLELMKAMVAQLTSHNITPCSQGFEIPEQLQEHLQQAEYTLIALHSVIREYTTLRQQLLEDDK